MSLRAFLASPTSFRVSEVLPHATRTSQSVSQSAARVDAREGPSFSAAKRSRTTTPSGGSCQHMASPPSSSSAHLTVLWASWSKLGSRCTDNCRHTQSSSSHDQQQDR